MNEITANGDKRMTVREVAEVMGCNPETIKKHIRELYPDLMANGVVTYLTETQATVILERIKTPVSSGAKSNLQFEIAGVKTSQSRVLQLQVLQVNARELHTALEVGRDFSTWIKDRIEKYGFVEGADYHLPRFGEVVNRPQGGGTARDLYLFSIGD